MLHVPSYKRRVPSSARSGNHVLIRVSSQTRRSTSKRVKSHINGEDGWQSAEMFAMPARGGRKAKPCRHTHFGISAPPTTPQPDGMTNRRVYIWCYVLLARMVIRASWGSEVTVSGGGGLLREHAIITWSRRIFDATISLVMWYVISYVTFISKFHMYPHKWFSYQIAYQNFIHPELDEINLIESISSSRPSLRITSWMSFHMSFHMNFDM